MRRALRGFTLLEVMLALALLGLGLVVLIKSAAGNIFNAQQSHMMGVATDLARAKMYQIEEMLLKDGFSDTEKAEEDRPFEDEGWPAVLYSYKVEVVELPAWDQLQAMAKGRCSDSESSSGSSSGAGAGKSGSGSGEGEGVEEGCFENSALGGMLTQFGGAGFGGGGAGKGMEADAAAGASFIQGQYQMFQELLKVTIRKVTLVVKWKVLGSDRDMKVVAFFTDPAAMDKVLNGLGAAGPPDAASGSGSGSGSGTGGGTGSGSDTRRRQ
jgi:general secretion pathway protein I